LFISNWQKRLVLGYHIFAQSKQKSALQIKNLL
jgi:hypothetical protein